MLSTDLRDEKKKKKGTSLLVSTNSGTLHLSQSRSQAMQNLQSCKIKFHLSFLTKRLGKGKLQQLFSGSQPGSRMNLSQGSNVITVGKSQL